MTEHEEPADCCFDEWAVNAARRARRKGTATKITGILAEALQEAGLDGRTFLDVGCGSGDLALSALARGAARATGFDLGPGAIEEARRLAEERGLDDRASFDVGDGSRIPLPAADVVSLNRVLCCYPNADALLDNTLGAAGTVYGYTAPIDRGPIGASNRATAAVANRWYAVRKRRFRGFRTYIHDLTEVDDRIRRAGFSLARRERHGIWHLAVYVRDGTPDPPVPATGT